MDTEWGIMESTPGTGWNFHLCRHVQIFYDSTRRCELHAKCKIQALYKTTDCCRWTVKLTGFIFVLLTIQKYYYARCFVWARKLVSQVKKKIWDEDVPFRSEHRHQLVTDATQYTYPGSQLRTLFNSYMLRPQGNYFRHYSKAPRLCTLLKYKDILV